MMHMTPSFAEARGFGWPKEIACVVNGVPRTWKQVHEERKKSQTERLRRKLSYHGPVKQAGLIWVFYVPGVIYGGWHLYLRAIGREWWVRGRGGVEEERIISDLMVRFPCGVLPFRENFYEWKEKFAAQFVHGKRGKKPQGIVYGWVYCKHAGAFPDSFTEQLKEVKP